MDTLKYDYDIQAWCSLIDGEWWVEPCNHPPEMDCKCTGKIYGGYRADDVPRDEQYPLKEYDELP